MSNVHEDRRGGARVRMPPPIAFLGGMALGFLLGFLLPVAMPVRLATRLVVGGALIAGGLSLGIWCIRLFRRTGQDPAPWTPTPSLIERGPYRFSRNPIYLGMIAIQLGVGMCAGNLWVLLFAVPALLVVHFGAVLPEEAYLAERFGDDYLRYKSAVRRYL